MEKNIKKQTLEEVLEGFLFLYSETGTEGGYWAFQDSRYIQQDVPQGYCKNCGTYMKEQNMPLQRSGTVLDVREFETGAREKGCAGGEHEEERGDTWSYEGLHILHDGDRLTVYHPNRDETVWSGTVDLKRHEVLTEHAQGMRIHADQIGVEREIWAAYFFEGYRARLIPAIDHV